MAEDKYLLSQTKSGLKEWIPTTGAGGVMVYPGAGIPVSTGTAWGGSITDNSANWNTAYSDRLKWDGGATGLTAATGRTSLGLGTSAVQDAGYFALSGHDHSGTYSPVLVADILDFQTNKYTPYAAKSAGKFDVGTVAPSNTNRLNYDGDLYVSDLYSTTSLFASNQVRLRNTSQYYESILTWQDFNMYAHGYSTPIVSFNPNLLNGVNRVANYVDTGVDFNNPGTKMFEARNFGVNKFHVMDQQSYSQRNIVNDYDGNEYHTVIIGDQEWIVENLKVTHSSNGLDVPLITNAGSWAADTDGAYCYYNNDVANIPIYGLLYNWYALDNFNLAYFKKDGIVDIGWRLPTDNDFNKLVEFLGGSAIAGGRMKEMGLAHWTTPNTDAINSSGFTALPGGYRDSSDGSYNQINELNYLWTQELGLYYALYNTASFQYDGVGDAKLGASIRCVRDISTKVVKTATPAFANPLVCDATVYKNFVCGTITGNTTITLQNTSDGDHGFIKITIDGTGGYTVSGSGLGSLIFDASGYNSAIATAANNVTFIEYWNINGDILRKITYYD